MEKKIQHFFFQMYNLIIKCPKLKSSAIGSFLLYEKDKCNDCNCSFTLVKTWEKVDFELSNSPFWGFSTKVLLL